MIWTRCSCGSVGKNSDVVRDILQKPMFAFTGQRNALKIQSKAVGLPIAQDFGSLVGH